MLKQRLLDIKPRETSGARAANRFDFQDDWALCTILALHEAGNDYVVVFDYHDDVIVLDSATDPQLILFYQIKTKKTGNWSRSSLLYRKNGESGKLPSILGKLYGNYLRFPSQTAGLQFVSNAYFDLELPEGKRSVGKTLIRFNTLDPTEQKKIAESLKMESGRPVKPAGTKLVTFQHSDLSLTDHTDHALGKLTSFLDRLPDTTTEGANAFFRTLKGEIARRAKSERTIETFEELCIHRAISRANFASLLDEVRGFATPSDIVGNLRNRLDAEGVRFREVRRLCHAARKFVTDRFDPTNRMLEIAASTVSDLAAEDDHDRLHDAVNALLPTCKTALEAQDISLDDDYIRAMIGVILSEA